MRLFRPRPRAGISALRHEPAAAGGPTRSRGGVIRFRQAELICLRWQRPEILAGQ